MVKWKQDWLEQEKYMLRICPHSQAHPDPDEISVNIPENHGCDGCCNPASQFMDDFKELVKEYEKPDYLTPTSIGPFYSGSSIEVPAEPDDYFFDDILTKLDGLSIRKTEVSVSKTDGRDAKELR